ncbi:TRAP transporter, 4TM/12TM fusion protein [uncultured delta proteobacterium]|uniref:TRAP transporter, 4TM/12TM fusion protein n=1 Tax=uncultured delta proteobacterium TaxID=34034 RepID=A0A212JIQ8_9DELT|nr:TRAP transporter, 4TM/12TM fusion protein [uncultured delta proteobacterium]
MQPKDTALQWTVKGIAIIFALFSITIALVPYDALSARSSHLLFALVLTFLSAGILKNKSRNLLATVFYITLAVLAAACCAYIIMNAYDLQQERLGVYTMEDRYAGGILILLIIIATWRTFGLVMTLIVFSFMAYLFFGQHLPSAIGHPGISLNRIIGNLGLSTEGVFGSPIGASTSVISAFIIFAAFLEVSGAANLFMSLSMALFGRFSGGAAKVAVVASSLFGAISGSAAANVAGTGMITIPLMKKSGFSPRMAGAVEATASSGGQIMPPIMGAAAFIMAEVLSVPYTTVMVAAIVPAIIYYVAIFFGVDLYSRKHGIKGVAYEGPGGREMLLKQGHMLLPLVILIVLIAAFSTSPQYAALWGTLSIVVVSWVRKETRFGFKKLIDSLYQGAMGVLSISVICAASGLIIGIFTVTGIGLKLSSAIISFAGGSLLALLVLAMIASLILGMGVPTVAAYLILAILVAPAVTGFGVLPIAAHMFVFYFGIISAITPPVALAAYVAAGIADDKPMQVGVEACLLALPAFLLPYIFVYHPGLLMVGTWTEIVPVVISSIVGSFLCAVAVQGYMFTRIRPWERLLIFGCSLCALTPEPITDVIGLGGAGVLLFIFYSRAKREKAAIADTAGAAA